MKHGLVARLLQMTLSHLLNIERFIELGWIIGFTRDINFYSVIHGSIDLLLQRVQEARHLDKASPVQQAHSSSKYIGRSAEKRLSGETGLRDTSHDCVGEPRPLTST